MSADTRRQQQERQQQERQQQEQQQQQQHTISDAELADIYTFAIQLGKDAGQILLSRLQRRRRDGDGDGDDKDEAKTDNNDDQPVEELVLHEKLNAVDIVTATDTEVEAFIHAAITQRYPSHGFVGEETYSQGSSKEYLVRPDRPTWVVDPLDGTVNFTHGFGMFCVSIALVVDGQEPVVGVVYAPLLGQLFSACRGRGAWLNETTRLPLLGRQGVGPIPRDAPAKCVFACEWGKDRRDIPDGNLHRKVDSFVTMASELSGRGGRGGMVHGVRSLGSATLDLAYTAMGSFDIWWEGGCWEWDVAAGICLLKEAGGLVTTANPPEDWETTATTTTTTTTAEIVDAKLGGRLYLAIRPASDGPDGETARQGQERCVREVWRRVGDWTIRGRELELGVKKKTKKTTMTTKKKHRSLEQRKIIHSCLPRTPSISISLDVYISNHLISSQGRVSQQEHKSER
ncbi:hypothetical protein AYL99_07269 [Fonsecaea erecta]|uniref:Inositol-phosphate phosphatase n=1 Tax=Fonsecaea erecta TaxID=1367422 RepID=A0A178ZEG8_9EURO|nr:hypothetical protein AYL99_07269 [Fonsecaea erecta]OAP58179.1 hypothetical protein AYL99_07269 [Fonsecaea erecta]